MTRLRRKLEQLGLADSILTVRGRGYRLLLWNIQKAFFFSLKINGYT
jgi:hypothetical protein